MSASVPFKSSSLKNEYIRETGSSFDFSNESNLIEGIDNIERLEKQKGGGVFWRSKQEEWIMLKDQTCVTSRLESTSMDWLLQS